MGAVADFVGDVGDVVGDVVDVVGDVAEDVVQVAGDAVEDVGSAVGDVVEGALEDPIGTMATVAAISTGQYYLLPAISAGKVVANGGDLDDALKAAAITYAAGELGGMAGDQVSTATQYGTDLGSQQTAMLASQNAGMGVGNALGGATSAAVGAGTGALLSGGDVGQAIVSGLAGYGSRLGMNLGMDAAGRVVNEVGDVVADSYNQLESMMGDQYGDQEGDFPTTREDLVAADTELGGLPSINEGDQPGDFPTTKEELVAGDQELADMELPDTTVYGDQEGDFPTTQEDLELENQLMGQMGDQPGDYDTTKAEMESSEQTLGSMPDAVPMEDFELDSSGIGKYLKDQYSKAFLRNLMGTTGGVTTGTVGLNGLYGMLNRSQELDDAEDESEPTNETTAPKEELSLFDPVGDASWAPQTKLSGLGFAGKFINQEDNTYYLNPEQARKEKEAQENYEFGWDTGLDEPTEDQYYEYEEPDVEYAADGGLIGHNPQFFSEGGMGNRYVRGEGDGTSDSVPAMLASGEFVIPADVVSGLGNGDNDAGAHVLDEFMKAIRKHKRAAAPSELPEDSKGPLSYLEEAMKKARK